MEQLIHRHPGNTLHRVYGIRDFLEALPGESRDDIVLSHAQTFGLSCMLKSAKGALQFAKRIGHKSGVRWILICPTR